MHRVADASFGKPKSSSKFGIPSRAPEERSHARPEPSFGDPGVANGHAHKRPRPRHIHSLKSRSKHDTRVCFFVQNFRTLAICSMGVALKREMRNKSDARFRARDPSFILPFHRVAHGRARKCLIARRLGVPGSHPKGGEATLSLPARSCWPRV